MTNLIPIMIIAAVGGIAVALQAQFMGLLDNGIGTLEGVFINYITGVFIIGFAILATRGGNLSAWKSVPWYALTTGILGLIIGGTIGYSTPRLGLVTTFTILVATQFIVGGLLDNFGIFGADLRPINLTRLGGMGVMLLGVWLIIR